MTVTIVLALATLGGTTEIGSFPFFVTLPKVAEASTIVIVLCHCHQHFRLKIIANVQEPLRDFNNVFSIQKPTFELLTVII